MSDEEDHLEANEGHDNLKQELEKAMNGWRRAQADFENFKKQKEKESKELVEFAREVTVVKLLPTLDTLAQALKHLPEYRPHLTSPIQGEEKSSAGAPVPLPGGEGDEFLKQYSNWQMGVSGILMQLDQVLGELGIKKIEAVGKKFDPNFHEAVKEAEGEEDGMVVEELQTGFELNGKVIRPSQVVISKRK